MGRQTSEALRVCYILLKTGSSNNVSEEFLLAKPSWYMNHYMYIPCSTNVVSVHVYMIFGAFLYIYFSFN